MSASPCWCISLKKKYYGTFSLNQFLNRIYYFFLIFKKNAHYKVHHIHTLETTKTKHLSLKFHISFITHNKGQSQVGQQEDKQSQGGRGLTLSLCRWTRYCLSCSSRRRRASRRIFSSFSISSDGFELATGRVGVNCQRIFFFHLNHHKYLYKNLFSKIFQETKKNSI